MRSFVTRKPVCCTTIKTTQIDHLVKNGRVAHCVTAAAAVHPSLDFTVVMMLKTKMVFMVMIDRGTIVTVIIIKVSDDDLIRRTVHFFFRFLCRKTMWSLTEERSRHIKLVACFITRLILTFVLVLVMMMIVTMMMMREVLPSVLRVPDHLLQQLLHM